MKALKLYTQLRKSCLNSILCIGFYYMMSIFKLGCIPYLVSVPGVFILLEKDRKCDLNAIMLYIVTVKIKC